MGKLNELICQTPLPKMYRVRQSFEREHVADIDQTVRQQILKPEISRTIRPGMRVAITAGSRGIHRYAEILRAVVNAVKELGAEPFIFPAMGSHGGATAEGQTELLESLGICEAFCGAPIVSSMDVVRLGETEKDVPVWFSKDAFEADATILVNRIKPHTAFRGYVESGVVKIGVVGCGKQPGAEGFHSQGMENMAENLVAMGKVMLEKSNVAFGLAIVENAYDETMLIEAIARTELMAREHELLQIAKRSIAKILIPEFDVLIVDQIGKNISGDGADPNITGRFYAPGIEAEPHVQRIVYLHLTEESHGNAIGLGVADCISQNLFEKIDRESMYMNVLTNCVPGPAKIPMVLQTDRLAVQAAIRTTLHVDHAKPRVVRILDSLHLGEIEVSEALVETVRKTPGMEVLSEGREIQFDENGTILREESSI